MMLHYISGKRKVEGLQICREIAAGLWGNSR